jgi:hypothetical protein
MKKVPLLVGLVILILAGILTAKSLMGTRPFKDLREADIAEVTVELLPPGMKLAVNEEETARLTEILRRVVIYGRDDTQYAGQAVIFTLSMTDGTQTVINAYNPLMVINGAAYKTKYEPCQELSSLANNLEAGKDG